MRIRALGSAGKATELDTSEYEIYLKFLDGYNHWSEADPRLAKYYDVLTRETSAFAYDILGMSVVAHEVVGWLDYGPTRKNGPKPDVNAPGEKVTAARSNSVDHQAVVTLSGTSMAAPHVTGAMALVLSARQKKCHSDPTKKLFNAINLAGMVKRSSVNYNKLHNKGYGYGRLNALQLFTEADLQ
jgi:hypothetical protein